MKPSEKMSYIINKCYLNKDGYTAADLAIQLNCHERTVRRIINNIISMKQYWPMFYMEYLESEDFDFRRGHYPKVLKVRLK